MWYASLSIVLQMQILVNEEIIIFTCSETQKNQGKTVQNKFLLIFCVVTQASENVWI